MGAASLNILYARDISLSGLGVHVPHGLREADLGNELDLLITLSGGHSFLTRGVVRHRNDVAMPNFFGVEFSELKPSHREEIRRFIARLHELGVPPDSDTG